MSSELKKKIYDSSGITGRDVGAFHNWITLVKRLTVTFDGLGVADIKRAHRNCIDRDRHTLKSPHCRSRRRDGVKKVKHFETIEE